MSTPLLEVKNLKKHFPIKGGVLGRTVNKVYAVDGVSFDVMPGETVGLVGESGCGKSTLGRAILRLHEPTAGEIKFEGVDFMKLSSSELRAKRKDMQIIFQDPFSSLNPRMTVRNILAEPYHIHKLGTTSEIMKKVDVLLEDVGLPNEAADRYPHEFSGGQRQRIGIARSIALNPKLIVADEPVSALDVSIQSQILNLMADLRSKLGLSYIFIAHDLAVIEHISDSVAVMYLGKIVEYAGGDDLYAKPTHPYTKALIDAIPEPIVNREKKSNILTGDVPSPIHPPSGCHFHPRCPAVTAKCKTVAPELTNRGSEKKPHWVSCHNA
jgi:oligopeptide/dipeptide ABC transporter ATP-binding protein